MVKLIRLVGARPQFMQINPLWDNLKKEGFEQVLVHTGQHYSSEMSSNFIKELNLVEPSYNLDVGSGSHAYMTADILKKFEDVLKLEKPDGLIVDGDTNSTLGGALSAAKLNIPVFHIESGTRDLDKRRPEEINRILTDHLSSLCFAPTEKAYMNLQKEGLAELSSFTGDLLLDSYLNVESRLNEKILNTLNLKNKNFTYITLHRPENTDFEAKTRFVSILKYLEENFDRSVYPVHPRVLPLLQEVRNEFKFDNIHFIEPISYFDSLVLSKNAEWVFTDSGGVSREAVWGGAKCVMVFKKLTWAEFVDNQLAIAITGEYEDLYEQIGAQCVEAKVQPDIKLAQGLFGSGKASKNITEKIVKYFAGSKM